jgi:hypothetical protein
MSPRIHIALLGVAAALCLAAGWPELRPRPAGEQRRKDAAAVIAVERYADLDAIPGARVNGQLWVHYFEQALRIPRTHIHVREDDQARDVGVLEAAEAAASSVEPGGSVWFVFIGHGWQGRRGDALLVGYDAPPDDRTIERRSVSQNEVLDILEQSQAAHVYAFMDTCFSGQLPGGKSLVANLQGRRPARAVARPSSKSVVFTAAAGDQFAGPLPGEERPAFTYLALGGLFGWGDLDHDGRVRSDELLEFLSSTFRRVAPSQTPTVFPESAPVEIAPSLREDAPAFGEILRRITLRQTGVYLVADPTASGIADGLERLLRQQGVQVVRASGGGLSDKPVVRLSADRRGSADGALQRVGIQLSVRVLRDQETIRSFERNGIGGSTLSQADAAAAAEAQIVKEMENENLLRTLGLE